jgi:hypothetical protein
MLLDADVSTVLQRFFTTNWVSNEHSKSPSFSFSRVGGRVRGMAASSPPSDSCLFHGLRTRARVQHLGNLVRSRLASTERLPLLASFCSCAAGAVRRPDVGPVPQDGHALLTKWLGDSLPPFAYEAEWFAALWALRRNVLQASHGDGKDAAAAPGRPKRRGASKAFAEQLAVVVPRALVGLFLGRSGHKARQLARRHRIRIRIGELPEADGAGPAAAAVEAPAPPAAAEAPASAAPPATAAAAAAAAPPAAAPEAPPAAAAAKVAAPKNLGVYIRAISAQTNRAAAAESIRQQLASIEQRRKTLEERYLRRRERRAALGPYTTVKEAEECFNSASDVKEHNTREYERQAASRHGRAKRGNKKTTSHHASRQCSLCCAPESPDDESDCRGHPGFVTKGRWSCCGAPASDSQPDHAQHRETGCREYPRGHVWVAVLTERGKRKAQRLTRHMALADRDTSRKLKKADFFRH